MPKPPSQFMIINDDQFVNAGIETSTSFAGLKIDIASASASNKGNLSLFCVGENLDKLSERIDYSFRVQKSGSLGSST